MNLQPKQNETKSESEEVKDEPMESKSNEEQDRKQKIRKTYVSDADQSSFSSLIQQEIEKKKKELAELEQKSNEVESDKTVDKQTASNEKVDDKSNTSFKTEQMDVGATSNENHDMEVDEDPGEIHIVSKNYQTNVN